MIFNILGNLLEKPPEQANWQNVNAANFNDFWNPNRYQGMQDEANRLKGLGSQYGLGGQAEQNLLGRSQNRVNQFSGLSRMKSAGLLGEAMNSMQRQYASQGISGTASNSLMKAGRQDMVKRLGEQNYQQDAQFMIDEGARTEQGLLGIYGLGAQYNTASADATKNYYGLAQNEMVSGAQEKNRVGIANSQGLLQSAMFNAQRNDDYKNRWGNMFNDLGNGLNNMAFNIAGKMAGGMF